MKTMRVENVLCGHCLLPKNHDGPCFPATHRLPEPPAKPWPFWVGVGICAVVAAVGIVIAWKQ